MWHVFTDREGVFGVLWGTSSFLTLSKQKWHLLMIAAMQWAEYQTQISKQHDVFESSSRLLHMNAASLHVMQRGRAQRCRRLYVALFSPIKCAVVVFELHPYGSTWLTWFDYRLEDHWFKVQSPKCPQARHCTWNCFQWAQERLHRISRCPLVCESVREWWETL